MKRYVKGLILAALVLCFFATALHAQEGGKFRVVPGTNDNAYLVDTQTGAVWVLTQRTLATGTGREPVAIPYKFLYLLPDQGYVLDEEGRKVPAGTKRQK